MSNERADRILSHVFQKDQFQTGEENPTAANSKSQTLTAISQENSTASHPQVGKTAVTRVFYNGCLLSLGRTYP